MALPQDTLDEIALLAQQFGTPITSVVRVCSHAFWQRTTSNRTREVCMVIRRPNGKLLTFTKSFYPQGLYRLFTGGVEPGEQVLEALEREVEEETGLQVNMQRLLAVVAYCAEDDPQGSIDAVRFATFAFLLNETGGMLTVTDPDEPITDYKEIEPSEVLAIADQLDHLPAEQSPVLQELWSDWGRFRAVIHYVVGELLLADSTE